MSNDASTDVKADIQSFRDSTRIQGLKEQWYSVSAEGAKSDVHERDDLSKAHSRTVKIRVHPDTNVELTNSYSHRGKRIATDQVKASWSEGHLPTAVTLSGAVIKKDGTPGAAHAEEAYSLDHARNDRLELAPQWVLDLFTDLLGPRQ